MGFDVELDLLDAARTDLRAARELLGVIHTPVTVALPLPLPELPGEVRDELALRALTLESQIAWRADDPQAERDVATRMAALAPARFEAWVDRAHDHGDHPWASDSKSAHNARDVIVL